MRETEEGDKRGEDGGTKTVRLPGSNFINQTSRDLLHKTNNIC